MSRAFQKQTLANEPWNTRNIRSPSSAEQDGSLLFLLNRKTAEGSTPPTSGGPGIINLFSHFQLLFQSVSWWENSAFFHSFSPDQHKLLRNLQTELNITVLLISSSFFPPLSSCLQSRLKLDTFPNNRTHREENDVLSRRPAEPRRLLTGGVAVTRQLRGGKMKTEKRFWLICVFYVYLSTSYTDYQRQKPFRRRRETVNAEQVWLLNSTVLTFSVDFERMRTNQSSSSCCWRENECLRRSEQPVGSSPAAGVHVHSLIWTPLLRWLLMSVGQIEEHTQVAGIRPEEEALP